MGSHLEGGRVNYSSTLVKDRAGVSRRVRQAPIASKKRKFVGRYRLGIRNKLKGGVYMQQARTRAGTLLTFYIARINVCGRRLRRTFSADRLGHDGARMAASLQRLVWLIDFEIWNPRDGDPFEILNFRDTISRNGDYENSVNVEKDARWVPAEAD